MDLGTLKGQLDTTESQLGQYSADLPAQIEAQINSAYTPALENSLNTTKEMMGDYLGRYFDATQMGPGMAGSTAMDLSPTQKLGVMGRELGTMSGELNATSKFSDYLGGQAKDMYAKALQAMQMGQQNLADQYNRQFQMYQLAWQEAEAAKDRALQQSLAPQYGGGNNGDNPPPPPPPKDINTGKSWTDQFLDSNWTGRDLSAPGNQSLVNAGSAVLFNPVGTGIKTIGGLAGNLIGNWGNENMNFRDKLFNNRSAY